MLPEKWCIKSCKELWEYGKNGKTDVNGNLKEDSENEYYYWYVGSYGSSNIKENWDYTISKKIPEDRILISFETFIKYHNKKEISYEIY